MERSHVPLEADLEDWCEADPSLLVGGLRIVGRQVRCDGGFIDLLGIDAQERWVVVELKRARLYRDALVQAIDYASCIRRMDGDDLRSVIEKCAAAGPEGEGVSQQVEAQLAVDEDGREVAIIVAGTGTDAGLHRVVDFLSEFDLPIRVVAFDVFEEDDGSRLLLREVLDDEEAAPLRAERRKKRTVDQLAARAEEAGVGEAFRRIIRGAEAAGLFCRPYTNSVMVTPGSHHGRYLMILNPRPGSGLRYHYEAQAFSEFFDLDESEIEEMLGGPGGDDRHLTSDDWEDGVGALEEFFEVLPEEMEIQGDRRADYESVAKYAQEIRPGEWTSYRALSIAATGLPHAAMAVGGHARSRKGFPNAQRVLGHTGRISTSWRTEGGDGPSECRAMLESEGLTFDGDGKADPDRFVPGEVLVQRAASV